MFFFYIQSECTIKLRRSFTRKQRKKRLYFEYKNKNFVRFIARGYGMTYIYMRGKGRR